VARKLFSVAAIAFHQKPGERGAKLRTSMRGRFSSQRIDRRASSEQGVICTLQNAAYRV
jgi:hypothetical protein